MINFDSRPSPSSDSPATEGNDPTMDETCGKIQGAGLPGLVLEGGGLRGVYTSGVLEALHELGLSFAKVTGTSMGAGNGANWVAGQVWRNRVVNIRFVRDSRWFSWFRLLRTGEAFGMDFIYGELPLRLEPFDFHAFFTSPVDWHCTLTDVDTGEALHVGKMDLDRQELMTLLAAATSLPWIGQPRLFRGRRVMDGGLADSIPLSHAETLGPKRHVVVLTQARGYRKEAAQSGAVLRMRHPRCPGLWKALSTRHLQYQDALDLCHQREADGKVFLLQPRSALEVGRLTRDRARLEALCDLGYTETMARKAELQEWLCSFSNCDW